MNYKTLVLALVALTSTVANASDVQAYPGIQFRLEQDFLDVLTKEFFEVLPVVMEKIEALIPKEITVLNVKVSDITLKDFQIDTERAKFTIDKANRGIRMNWAKLVNYQFHCHVRFGIFFFIAVNWDIDVFAKNATLDNGLSILGNDHSGAPSVDFFGTKIDIGQSYYRMSGNFIMYLISFFTDLLLKYPLEVLVNLFIQPGINFVINDVIIPFFFQDGMIEIKNFHQGNETTSLMLDFTLPENPQIHDNSIDTFNDGAIYFKNHGETFKPPTSPMRYQFEDYSLQMVASSFTVNQVVETVLETGLIVLPIDHRIIKEFVGIDLTTTLMLVIIPELFYNYGSRSLNLQFTPISGTDIDWSQDNKTTDAHIKMLADFIIVESDNSTKLAFQAVLDIEADIALNIEETNKTVNLQFSDLEIQGFNVVVDNCNVKSDQDNIKTRLNAIMGAIELSVNQFVKVLSPKLPEFQTFDYKIHFDYQDHGFGTGISITPKKQ